MDNKAHISLINGLGDKMLDLIGFYVICKYLNYDPQVTVNGIIIHCQWGNGNYDIKLFNFDNITITEECKCDFFINVNYAASELCPYKVYIFLKNILPEVTFEEISNSYIQYSKEIIKPSEIILSKIPPHIENAYGIHLRKTDKVKECLYSFNFGHENSIKEFEIIKYKLLEDVLSIILIEEEPTFLFVSEDDKWKNEITDEVKKMSFSVNKKIKIINLDYTTEINYNNYNSVLDMFCLSKCKEILQCVKYSSFSVVASLIGNNKIRNYTKFLPMYDVCLIYNWSSVIEINNEKNLDVEFHRNKAVGINNFHTNITSFYKS
jgi:hypothetical protein